MSSTTHPSAAPAVTAEHPVATAGRLLVRYGLVVVIAWIGALKYTTYEAVAIQPLVAHSPPLSWVYHIFSVRTFAAVLGTVEIIAALLIALRPLPARSCGPSATRSAPPGHMPASPSAPTTPGHAGSTCPGSPSADEAAADGEAASVPSASTNASSSRPARTAGRRDLTLDLNPATVRSVQSAPDWSYRASAARRCRRGAQ